MPRHLVIAILVLFLAACTKHDRPVRVVSNDGATEIVVALDGDITFAGNVVGKIDVGRRILTMTSGPSAGTTIDVYDATRTGGSVIWRGPDYTLRNFGQTWSVVANRDVHLNGKPWGRCTGCDGTNPQRIRFVAAVSALVRVTSIKP